MAETANRRPPMRKHLLIVLPVAVLASIGLGYLFSHVDLIPGGASLERQSIDRLFEILLTIAAVIFSLIMSAFIYSLVAFRRRRGDSGDAPGIRGYPPAEILWTIVPLIIVVTLGSYGGIVLDNMSKPAPAGQAELEVDVTAFRFGWQFNYPQYGNGTSYELGLPVDRRVVFKIQSKDVVHSFWVKEFGPKQDAVPGMTTTVRITPTRIGKYQVQCSQLCGDGHTLMVAPVSVMSASDFDTWTGTLKKAGG